MHFDDYQKQAKTTLLPMKGTVDSDYMYLLLGLPAEVGELLEIFAKGIRDGFGPDVKRRMGKEIGDCLWFLAMIMDKASLRLDDAAKDNLNKLYMRAQNDTLRGSGDDR